VGVGVDAGIVRGERRQWQLNTWPFRFMRMATACAGRRVTAQRNCRAPTGLDALLKAFRVDVLELGCKAFSKRFCTEFRINAQVYEVRWVLREFRRSHINQLRSFLMGNLANNLVVQLDLSGEHQEYIVCRIESAGTPAIVCKVDRRIVVERHGDK